MKYGISFVALALLSATTSGAVPVGDDEPQARTPQEILERAIEAMGGREALESIETARYLFKSADPESSVKRAASTTRGNNEFVFIVAKQIGLWTTAYNGEMAWFHGITDSTVACMILGVGDAAHEDASMFAMPHRLALDLLSPEFDIRFAGRTVVQEMRCVSLHVTRKRDLLDIYHFDLESGLPFAVSRRRQDSDGRMESAVYYYQDWQQFEDVLLPGRIVMERADGRDSRDIIMTSASFNAKTGDVFNVPDCVREIQRSARWLDEAGNVVNHRPIAPGVLTRKEIELMSDAEVREAIQAVSRQRMKARAIGDHEEQERLRQEFDWLMQRMRQGRQKQ